MRVEFDNDTYIALQVERIRERIGQFGGKLYLEFGGKFFDDYHVSRASERFHESLGFRLAGVFSPCGYKFGRWYDAAWMEKRIGTHGSDPTPVRPFPEIALKLFAPASRQESELVSLC